MTITTKTKTVQVYECSVCGKAHKELTKAEACFRKCNAARNRNNKKETIISEGIAALERAETLQEIQDIVSAAHLSFFGEELNLKIEFGSWNRAPVVDTHYYGSRRGTKNGLMIYLTISYNREAFGTGNNLFDNLGIHTRGGSPSRMSAHIWLDDFPAIEVQWQKYKDNSQKIEEKIDELSKQMRRDIEADAEIGSKQLIVADLIEQAKQLLAKAQEIQHCIFVVGNTYCEHANKKLQEFQNTLPATPMFHRQSKHIYNLLASGVGPVDPDEE